MSESREACVISLLRTHGDVEMGTVRICNNYFLDKEYRLYAKKNTFYANALYSRKFPYSRFSFGAL